ncbi:hypothetical protein DUI87_05346 [Hirundo rustica rustica]|uniref:Uncharacterized protein n=1 Tax=Hirundo rustica rustica TaxID=333673 RepID=A0A3M0KWJ2_HIRRU|nr:hypothetical protein DUI87_05346 [Hirundo rustica rustica]
MGMAMEDSSLAVTPGLARKNGLGTEDMKHVLAIVGDELAMQDRLLGQGSPERRTRNMRLYKVHISTT